MSPTLKDVFDRQFDQVKFDKALCQRIIRFSQNFLTRNEDHAAFFGGVLLGVNPIKFYDRDREAWFEDVLEIDEELLVSDFRNVKSVNHKYKVSGDMFNYTPIYVVHRLEKETGIPQALRKQAQIHAFMVLHYRYLTSLLSRRFRYPAAKGVAQATYGRLSGRFDIRQFGSWRELLESRSKGLLETNSIYRRAIQNFGPDTMVIRIVTDTQGRIREVVKTIYAVYLDTLESGERVNSTSAMVMSTDGELVLRDKKGGYAVYLRYMNEVVQSERNFIRPELVDVVSSAMRTMPPQLLQESLTYLSRNFRQPHQGYLEEIVKEDLLYAFDYLQSNRALLGRTQDLPGLMSRLRNLLMASRSSTPAVLKLREQTEKLVNNAVKTRNPSVVASVRTGVLLYIVLRAMTKSYYTH